MKRSVRAMASVAAMAMMVMLAACDPPIVDSAREAAFHDGRAVFVSELKWHRESRPNEVRLSANFSGDIETTIQLAIMRAVPALYPDLPEFTLFTLPSSYRRGTTTQCKRYSGAAGPFPNTECTRSSTYLEGIFKIWPDKTKARKPYRSTAAAVAELNGRLAQVAKVDFFFCDDDANGCVQQSIAIGSKESRK